jgi:small subunit ribosomal protein S4e
MVKNHVKRISAPKTWNLARKKETFTMRPNAGKTMEFTLPIARVLRDNLKLALTVKEVKHIINVKTVMVNGRHVKDYRYPVMLMDVVSIKELNKGFRLLIDNQGKLYSKETEDHTRPSRVIGKTALKSGKIQLNLFDGTNLLSDKKDIKVGDIIVLDNKNEIKHHFKLEAGVTAYLIGGKHVGLTAKVVDVKKGTIVFEHGNEKFETLKEYAFVIGKDKPLIHV